MESVHCSPPFPPSQIESYCYSVFLPMSSDAQRAGSKASCSPSASASLSGVDGRQTPQRLDRITAPSQLDKRSSHCEYAVPCSQIHRSNTCQQSPGCLVHAPYCRCRDSTWMEITKRFPPFRNGEIKCYLHSMLPSISVGVQRTLSASFCSSQATAIATEVFEHQTSWVLDCATTPYEGSTRSSRSCVTVHVPHVRCATRVDNFEHVLYCCSESLPRLHHKNRLPNVFGGCHFDSDSSSYVAFHAVCHFQDRVHRGCSSHCTEIHCNPENETRSTRHGCH
jgi:hypothetical protein